jgi:hypothetical protein
VSFLSFLCRNIALERHEVLFSLADGLVKSLDSDMLVPLIEKSGIRALSLPEDRALNEQSRKSGSDKEIAHPPNFRGVIPSPRTRRQLSHLSHGVEVWATCLFTDECSIELKPARHVTGRIPPIPVISDPFHEYSKFRSES